MSALLVFAIMVAALLAFSRYADKRWVQDRDSFETALDNMRASDTSEEGSLQEERRGRFSRAVGANRFGRAVSTRTDSIQKFFTSASRCDRCCAESRYVAYKEKSSLFFCGHHLRAYADSLTVKGFTLMPNHPAELTKG